MKIYPIAHFYDYFWKEFVIFQKLEFLDPLWRIPIFMDFGTTLHRNFPIQNWYIPLRYQLTFRTWFQLSTWMRPLVSSFACQCFCAPSHYVFFAIISYTLTNIYEVESICPICLIHETASISRQTLFIMVKQLKHSIIVYY